MSRVFPAGLIMKRGLNAPLPTNPVSCTVTEEEAADQLFQFLENFQGALLKTVERLQLDNGEQIDRRLLAPRQSPTLKRTSAAAVMYGHEAVMNHLLCRAALVFSGAEFKV